MKRSTFLQLSAFATAAISLPLLDSCKAAGGKTTLSRPAFLSRLFEEDKIQEVGIAYLKKTEQENDRQKLIQLLSDNGPIAESSDQQEIHQFLDEKIKLEFATGKTVMVKGWILALTEARQCALFSLIKG